MQIPQTKILNITQHKHFRKGTHSLIEALGGVGLRHRKENGAVGEQGVRSGLNGDIFSREDDKSSHALDGDGSKIM